MEGRVMKSTGSWYEVETATGQTFSCRPRGKLRLEGSKESNPVAVGDRVLFDDSDLTITEILPRENHILRQSVKKTGHTQVLAANVDQVLLVATLAYPRTSMGFIDRFLVTAESFRIPQVLIFNKKDLLNEDELNDIRQLLDMYEQLGVRVFLLSSFQEDIDEVRNMLEGKVTLMAGHSGVGKSTLLNRLLPSRQQKTGEVSSFSEKGTHTTTFAEMFRLDASSFVIDTPGVKEWGLVDMTEEEISDYFPEMRDRRLDCKFGARCLHMREPGCAIIKAVQEGAIALSRYESYLSMVMGEDNRK